MKRTGITIYVIPNKKPCLCCGKIFPYMTNKHRIIYSLKPGNLCGIKTVRRKVLKLDRKYVRYAHYPTRTEYILH